MDITESGESVVGDDERPPDLTAWDDPETVLDGGPTRERVLDVVVQLREPTTVSTVAERADCDPATAREYLTWFERMGIVREHEGRPVRYERNEDYLFWRRVQSVRESHSEAAIVDELADTLDRIADLRERFDAETPDAVSLLDRGASLEDDWRALSEWQTLEERARILDAARRNDATPSADADSIDA